MKSSHHNLIPRIIICIVGFIILCFGVVLTTKASIGVAPINSLPFYLSETTPFSLGTWTIILYVLLVLLQFVILKEFRLATIIQIPVALIFGQFVNLFNSLLNFKVYSWYLSVPLLMFAIAVVALGVTLVVGMNLVANPPDAFVDVVSKAVHKPYGLIKNIFDLTLSGITLVCCLSIQHRLIGVGIGTLIGAIECGRVIAILRHILKPILKIAEPEKKGPAH